MRGRERRSSGEEELLAILVKITIGQQYEYKYTNTQIDKVLAFLLMLVNIN